MANTFTIKRGADKPADGVLEAFELGYDKTNNNLYIGLEDGTAYLLTDKNKYLPLTGGNISGHIYLTGANANSSIDNTSQIVFGTPENNHVVLSSYTNALVINPTTSSNENQIKLALSGTSIFPSGITSTGTIAANLFSGSGASLTNLNAANIVSGILPITRGGTGLATSPSMVVDLTSISAVDILQPLPRPGVTGQLPLINGGTGTSFTDITPFAIIRNTDNTGSLWFTPTANGAFYATEDNTLAQFGTLPIAQGGTDATTAAAARTNLGFVMGSSTAKSSGSGTAVIFKNEKGEAVTFSSTPKVIASYSKTGANVEGNRGSLKIFNITTTGFFALIGGSNDETARNYDWIAIGNLA